MNDERYDRNIRFFGKEGQDRLADASVAIGGIGGLGTHVVQQLALLAVRRLVLIDHEVLDKTNFNSLRRSPTRRSRTRHAEGDSRRENSAGHQS